MTAGGRQFDGVMPVNGRDRNALIGDGVNQQRRRRQRRHPKSDRRRSTRPKHASHPLRPGEGNDGVTVGSLGLHRIRESTQILDGVLIGEVGGSLAEVVRANQSPGFVASRHVYVN